MAACTRPGATARPSGTTMICSEDFYRLFLDAELVYSCAYFTEEGTSLEEAQRAKLELVCRKLALAPGDRLLDVGCGWGALLEHAAARHGVEAVGITLSANQLAEARRRLAARAGPAHASAIAADYRLFRPDRPFTKVASVGMMEHVGRARLDEYFLAVDRLSSPVGSSSTTPSPSSAPTPTRSPG